MSPALVRCILHPGKETNQPHSGRETAMGLWTIDPAHSEIKFKVKHLVVSTVTGHFDSFRATVKSEKADFSDATITFEADVNSINTKNSQRDGHLKSADFFDAATYPAITFASRSVKR